MSDSEGPALKPPSVVVNWLKGDPAELRAHQWMEWDGVWDGLDAAFLGIPFDGASPVRTGSRGGPRGVRERLCYYSVYSVEDDRSMKDFRVADVGDVDVAVSDLQGSFDNIKATTKWLTERGIKLAMIGGDHSIAFPILSGICEAMPEKKIGIIQFDADHDVRESHFGAVSSGVPFRWLLDAYPEQIRGENLVQLGIADFRNHPKHTKFVKDHGVTVISNIAIWRDGIRSAIDRAIEVASRDTDAIYISVDMDGIDRTAAPGVAAPQAFGIDGRDAAMAIREFAQHPKTIGIDLNEIAPVLDSNEATTDLGALLTMNFLYGLANQ